MKITLKCACGATLDGEAKAGDLQTADLARMVAEWQERHAAHPTAATRQEEK